MKGEKIREEINAKGARDAKSVIVDVVVCVKNHPAGRAGLLKKEGSLCRFVSERLNGRPPVAPTGGVWLRENWCDAADKNHPAGRAGLLKKEGSLCRFVSE